jgi:hypothetical protein
VFAANIVEDLSRRTSASVSNVIEPLPDAFLSIGTGRNVKQSLISVGILHDGRCSCQQHLIRCYQNTPSPQSGPVDLWICGSASGTAKLF